MPAFHKILIANRGEIACRVMRTAKELGYRTVAVYSEADADARHVQVADEAVCIGPAQVNQSYLVIDNIIKAAQKTGADAIHPGYGFLSENADFARACEAAGIVFIGPTVEAIHLMGSKRLSKIAMLEAGVPCIPGYEGAAQDDETLVREAERIGYPLMIKASAGGGGRGMRLVHQASELQEQIRTARSEAQNAFGSGELILERAVIRPRHVEIQVFGDQHGNIVYLGERDCSVQRRHQKVVEEAPCPVMTPELRRAMGEAAVKAAARVNYVGAGTVEFLLDASGEFFFLGNEYPPAGGTPGHRTDHRAGPGGLADPCGRRPAAAAQAGRHHPHRPRHGSAPVRRGFGAQLPAADRPRAALGAGNACWHPYRSWSGRRSGDHPLLRPDAGQGHRLRRDPRRCAAQAGPCSGKLRAAGCERQPALPRQPAGQPRIAAGNATTAFIAEHFASDESLTPQALATSELAIAAALLYQESANSRSHQSSLAGWRSAGSAPWRFILKQGEHKHVVELEVLGDGAQPQLRARVGDSQVELHLLASDGRWLTLEQDGIRRRQAYHHDGDRLWLFGHFGNLELTDVTHEPAGGQNAASSGAVKAPMDGAIVDVLIEEGARVSKGQLLVVLEAMKMEHPLKAGVDGVVRRVGVSQGDQVKNRQLLVEIEADA